MALTFVNGLMTETRATKHERKPGRWHPSRLSLCWNFANLLGYGYYTTPAVVYASTDRLLFVKIACLKGLNFFLGQAILIIKNRELTH